MPPPHLPQIRAPGAKSESPQLWGSILWGASCMQDVNRCSPQAQLGAQQVLKLRRARMKYQSL